MAIVTTQSTNLRIFPSLRQSHEHAEMQAGWMAMVDSLCAGIPLVRTVGTEIQAAMLNQSEAAVAGCLKFLFAVLEGTEQASKKPIAEILNLKEAASVSPHMAKALALPGKARIAYAATCPDEESIEALAMLCAYVEAINTGFGGITFNNPDGKSQRRSVTPTVRQIETQKKPNLRHGAILQN